MDYYKITPQEADTIGKFIYEVNKESKMLINDKKLTLDGIDTF